MFGKSSIATTETEIYRRLQEAQAIVNELLVHTPTLLGKKKNKETLFLIVSDHAMFF